MGKQYDVAFKQMADRYGGDWSGIACVWAGLDEGTTATPEDADLSTVSPQADKLYRVVGPAGGLVHLEVQTSWDDDLAARLNLYNTLAEYRYGAPVRTVLLLLRREANSPSLTGVYTRTDERGEYRRFRYTVVRLWELSCEHLLAGPVGLLPFALLTDDAAGQLPQLIVRADERLRTEALSDDRRTELLIACNILLGARYDRRVVQMMFDLLPKLRDSSAYQLILDEGREEGGLRTLRESIADLASDRLGPPPATLNDIADRDRLRRILRRSVTASDWNDLLATP